jgi:predicted secreted protein
LREDIYMKNCLILATALIIALSMPCANALASPEPNDVIGSWHLIGVEVEGTPMNAAAIGMEATMVFRENNTALLDFIWEEEDIEGTWAVSDGQIIVSVDGTDVAFALINGTLSTEEDGNRLVFGRKETSAGAESVENESDWVYLHSDGLNKVLPGQLVCILLSENQTTPYRWEFVVSDDAAIELEVDRYTPDPNPQQADGVGGTHAFFFRVKSAGACSIQMGLVRIGEGVESALQTESYEIIIEDAPNSEQYEEEQN